MKRQPPIGEDNLRQAVNMAGSVPEAARFLDVPVRTLYRWMQHYGIRRESRWETTKPCTECGRVLPLEQFYVLNTGKRRPSCRDCYMKRIAAYKGADPARERAHKAVGRAVKSGKLVVPAKCACGSTARLNAHHEDYARPLDVEWLCGKCHSARHNGAAKAA